MQKLDRLGWAAGIAFMVEGLRIGIRVNRPEVIDLVQPTLPPLRRPCSGPVVDRLYSIIAGKAPSANARFYNLVYIGGRRSARTMNFREVLKVLDLDLLGYVAGWARQRVAVHAGVVAWKGQGILIPGSGSLGKTSLVIELLRLGAVYYSDELALFDRRGLVRPYPRPLAVRHGEKRDRYGPSHYGATTGSDPMSLGLVVQTQFKPGYSWKPRRVSRGKAILSLLTNAASTARHPHFALSTLTRALGSATILKGPRGEARETAEAILHLLDSNENQREQAGREAK
jgi:hypothetical protein